MCFVLPIVFQHTFLRYINIDEFLSTKEIPNTTPPQNPSLKALSLGVFT